MAAVLTINAHRGEVGITLDGKEYPMLPTYEAMAAVERRLGSVLSLSRRMLDPKQGLPTVAETAVLVTECIRAAGRARNDTILQEVSEEIIGQKLYEEGILEVMEAVSEVLGNMITGGTAPKKRSPTTTQT